MYLLKVMMFHVMESTFWNQQQDVSFTHHLNLQKDGSKLSNVDIN